MIREPAFCPRSTAASWGVCYSLKQAPGSISYPRSACQSKGLGGLEELEGSVYLETSAGP